MNAQRANSLWKVGASCDLLLENFPNLENSTEKARHQLSFCKSSLKTQKLTSVSFDEFSLKVQFVGPGEQAWKLLKIHNFKLESFHTLKMTGETPEVGSDKRKPREDRQNHRYHRYHGSHT